jgi:thermospermine synthase
MNDTKDNATEHQRSKGVFKYVEDFAPGLKLEMDLHSIHHTSISKFQEVQVIDSYFGRTLVTDAKTQSAEHDEFVYHESLVHPALFWSALLSKDGPKSVFIGGGGELATAREVLRHTSVERCVMVDIDPVVVDVCVKYLPEWGGQAVIDHPKMTYIVGDAHQYLMNTREKFDVIIMDISDPVEAGPGIALYTQEFYRRAAEVLNEECGVFVTQAGSAGFVPHPHAFPKEGNGEDENKETCCFR